MPTNLVYTKYLFLAGSLEPGRAFFACETTGKCRIDPLYLSNLLPTKAILLLNTLPREVLIVAVLLPEKAKVCP